MTAACSNCKTTCYTCENSYNCTSCNDAVTNRILLNGDCICKEKFFGSSCTACDISCKTCTGAATTCTSCNSTAFRVLDSNTNECMCMNNYVSDGLAEECEPCHFSCQNCVYTDKNNCTTCSDSAHRELSTPSDTCVCKIQYYSDGVN